MNKYIIFILVSYFYFNTQAQNKNNQVLKVHKTLILEMCNKNEFNPCSNFSPVKFSKFPEFLPFNNKKVLYDTIYRLPSIQFISKSSNDIDDLDLLNYFENPQLKTDTLSIKLQKRQRKRINRYIHKKKKKLKTEIHYFFDGTIKYLVYDLIFECVYIGKDKTYIVNKKGCDLIIEKDVDLYYITKILSINPSPRWRE